MDYSAVTYSISTNPQYWGNDCSEEDASRCARIVADGIRDKFPDVDIRFDSSPLFPSTGPAELVEEIDDYQEQNWVDWLNDADREQSLADARLLTKTITKWTRNAPRLLHILEGFIATLDVDDDDEQAVADSYFRTNISLWNQAIDANHDAIRQLMEGNVECRGCGKVY